MWFITFHDTFSLHKRRFELKKVPTQLNIREVLNRVGLLRNWSSGRSPDYPLFSHPLREFEVFYSPPMRA
jgi:hypothetical protein